MKYIIVSKLYTIVPIIHSRLQLHRDSSLLVYLRSFQESFLILHFFDNQELIEALLKHSLVNQYSFLTNLF